MVFHGNRPADDSYEISCLISFRKFAKMSQNVSSAAFVIGALRIKFMIARFSSSWVRFILPSYILYIIFSEEKKFSQTASPVCNNFASQS